MNLEQFAKNIKETLKKMDNYSEGSSYYPAYSLVTTMQKVRVIVLGYSAFVGKAPYLCEEYISPNDTTETINEKLNIINEAFNEREGIYNNVRKSLTEYYSNPNNGHKGNPVWMD